MNPQRQLKDEAGVDVVEVHPEEFLDLAQPVPEGVDVDVELAGGPLQVPVGTEIGVERLQVFGTGLAIGRHQGFQGVGDQLPQRPLLLAPAEDGQETEVGGGEDLRRVGTAPGRDCFGPTIGGPMATSPSH